jgi:histidinol-phosphate aminotransferase
MSAQPNEMVAKSTIDDCGVVDSGVVDRHASDRADVDRTIVDLVIREDVRAMQAYAVPDRTGLLKLDVMENPFEFPLALREALGRRLAAVEVNRYPEPRADALRSALREQMRVPAGCDLLLGNGSDELISLIVMAAARDGASVLSLVPGFAMFTMSTRLARLTSIGVPLTPTFALDRAATIAALREHRPVVAFLAYPNNPTGNLFERDDVEAVIAAARETGTLVIVDEAYQAFASDSFMPDLVRHDNLLVLRTVSKSGLAGARLGYLCGSPAWLEQIDKVRPPFNINVFTQCAVTFALEHADVLDAQAGILRDQRASLMSTLRSIEGITPFPSDANFILFRVAGAEGVATRVFEHLRRSGVLIKDLSRSHPLCANCLRVTVSKPEENATFVAALVAALREMHSS